MEAVRQLASVDPAVPRERITVLTGLWLRRETGETLKVSPLINVLKSEDLAEGVRQECHRVLAQQAMQKGRVTTNDLQNAITHLAAAQEKEDWISCAAVGNAGCRCNKHVFAYFVRHFRHLFPALA